jgi:hypothetical protein
MRFITLRNGDLYFYGRPDNPLDEYVIGAHLGKISRFAGATHTFYSIAQHSCFVADILRDVGQSTLTQLKGLLHDAHESFTSDMPTPYQTWLTDLIEERFGERFDVIEHSKTILDKGVYGAFGLDAPTKDEQLWIKYADKVALVTEANQLLDPTPTWIAEFKVEPAPYVLIPLQPEYATSAFVAKYRQLRVDLAKAA